MTKKLLIILFSLLILLGSFILIKKYNILEEIKKIIYYSNTSQIIIPNSTVNDRNYNYLTYKSTNNFYPKSKEDIKQIYYTVINNGWDEFTFYCPYEYKTCEQDIKKLITDDDFIATLNNYVSTYDVTLNADTAIEAEARLYDYMMLDNPEDPDGPMIMNPNSYEVKKAYVEPSLKDATLADRFQFMRNGYYCLDSKHSKPESLVFNRIVPLKSSFKVEK